VGEGDAHRRAVPAFLHAAEVDHPAAVAGTQLVEGGTEALVFSGVDAGRTARVGIPYFNEAMSMTKRYFTSFLSKRSASGPSHRCRPVSGRYWTYTDASALFPQLGKKAAGVIVRDSRLKVGD